MLAPRGVVEAPDLVTETSAWATWHCTVVETLRLVLLELFGSCVLEIALALFTSGMLQVAVCAMFTVILKLSVSPAASEESVHSTMLGVAGTAAQRLSDCAALKLINAGSTSVTSMFAAASGPAFVRVSV